jgi:hypothetical protein
MKMNSKKWFTALSCLVFTVASVSAANDDILKFLQLKLKYQPTPATQVNNYPNSNQGGYEWLALNITYTAPAARDKSGYKWLDDVTIEAEILFPAEFGGKSVLALLTGKTVYWSLEMDGKKHQEIMLVPPQIVRRLAGNVAGKNVQAAAKVTFYTKERTVLGIAFVEQKGMTVKDTAALFEKYSGPISNSLKLENTILSRDKTPWADVNYDYYDLIKIEKKN